MAEFEHRALVLNLYLSCLSSKYHTDNSPTMKSLTLWRCDICLVQRVNDAGVIFTKRQVFDQMGHVYLQDDRRED